MKHFIILGSVFFLLMALFLPEFILQRSKNQNLNKIAHEPNFPVVQVIKIEPETKEIELKLPSYLDAINITPIWARTNGYLINWLVDIGDKVKEGQLLATIDTPDVDQELLQAKGDLFAAIAKENIARITADRGTGLYKHNYQAISKEEVDQMIAAHQLALADVEAAKANVEKWKSLKKYQDLFAPFDGTIIERDIDIGSLITSGSNDRPQQLFVIAKYDVLRAFVDVPQGYFHLIKDGMEAEVTIPEFPKKIFVGRIDRNAGALDPIARTLLTQVNIENKNGDLLPGLYAEVKFKFRPATKNYIIPVEALIIRSGPPYVAVVKSGNEIHLQEVKIGRDFGTKIEIIEGLTEGDEIVANGTDRIREGIRVRKQALSM